MNVGRIVSPALCVALAISFSTNAPARTRGPAISASCASSRETVPLPSRRFVFPRDAAAHDGYAVEWWRTFGLVTDDAGDRFDFSVAVSRFAISPSAATIDATKSRWDARHFISTTYELLDENTLVVRRGAFVEREGPLGATVGRDRLAIAARFVTYASERSREVDARYALDVRDAAASNGLRLEQTPETPAVPLGPGGVMTTGSCAGDAAYAYAYPRNATRGTLRYAGVEHRVRGSSWIEHEFARTELAPNDRGWTRFEVQFDDGRDLDARFARDADGNVVATAGVLVASDGTVTYLERGSAEFSRPPAADRASASWHSDPTDVDYPSIWYLGVEPGRLGLAVVEVTHDQEVRDPGRTPYYWGAVVVEKADPPGGDRGHGFVELTGFAARRAL